MRAAHHCGPSCHGAQALDAQAQRPWPTGPAAPRHAGSSRTGARTRAPCIGRQTPNHCATREAPCSGFMAGGVAGVCVDLILFPLDTIKTRLQSPQGFNKAGGFRGIYAGVPSAAIGSFPNAAAFFITYEYVKWFLHTDSSSYLMPVKHMLAASAGEVGIQGLYRGYKSTVLREIPFSLVQFPLWESLKALWSWRQDHVVDSWQSAVCGAFAEQKRQQHFGVRLERWAHGRHGPPETHGTQHASPSGSLTTTHPRVHRWICSCSHHTSGRGKNQNHVGKGRLQPCKWERPLCPAWCLADTGAVGIICRCLPSNGSHQSGRFHLSWCL
ncbi:mitochondrial S-adenosylmethionine carrier protein isoform X3 [Lagenorhynchus albirostris]|uniref:mitochondrial S-adenosylmethionine carrier protein isoform X3 n=1 Tax=Lagenorhynchus albirostris TaxID=27610 RepID=UPI0028E374A4|nr:mitochondrial S-adenosylmethionine carrier protein isoform X3 [Lagenorhynchus albirostris]